MKARSFPAICVVVLSLLWPCGARGQTATSTISGRLTDRSDAVIAGAQVRVINQTSGVAVAVTSNETGLYHVASLAPGVYRLEIEAAGFQRVVRSNIVLQVSQVLQLDQTLEVGSVTETVAVSASANRWNKPLFGL